MLVLLFVRLNRSGELNAISSSISKINFCSTEVPTERLYDAVRQMGRNLIVSDDVLQQPCGGINDSWLTANVCRFGNVQPAERGYGRRTGVARKES
jgi:hypothetical protein